MKKVLTVVSHPNQYSFTHLLSKCYLKGVKEAGHESVVIDLYKEKFQPLLQLDENAEWGVEKQYEDVLHYQKLLNDADILTLIYPIWWASPPAVLSGWLQRVFRLNYAFRNINKGTEGLLQHDVQLIFLSGSSEDALDSQYISPITGVLKYCGITNIETYPVRGIHKFTPESKLDEYKHYIYMKGRSLV